MFRTIFGSFLRYGSEYMALDDKMLREDSVKDIGALLKWCASHPLIDEDRIAVCGGSYGGFMVLASLCAFSEQIRCGVSNVGICNWVTFLENTPEFRRYAKQLQCSPGKFFFCVRKFCFS